MKDTIYRDDAIDAVGNMLRRKFGVGGDLAETTIADLPSAQPEPCEDAVSRNAIIQKLNTMDRYVSEELILCDTDKKFPKNEVFIVDDVYEEIVENLPSAQQYDYSDGYADGYKQGRKDAQPDIKQAAKLLLDFIKSCSGGDSYLITPNGEELRTDWGYAMDGVQLIYKWAEREVKI